MIFNFILLAICVSIDSLGIGITYGVKNTKISPSAKWILLFISFFITSFSLVIGKIISSLVPTCLTTFLGSLLLVLLGVWIIIQSIRNPSNFDLDYSNQIDNKEAIYLGITLSLDAIGIGIGSSMIGISSFLFPPLVALFQLIFLNLGSWCGKKIHEKFHFPDNSWSIFSGILLILIAISKTIFS
mgnify:CR=1 FL=1